MYAESQEDNTTCIRLTSYCSALLKVSLNVYLLAAVRSTRSNILGAEGGSKISGFAIVVMGKTCMFGLPHG
jgi:hypothetical protein